MSSEVEGCCGAHVYIADDEGDNSATMVCALDQGHKGPHCETFTRVSGNIVTIEWTKDERCREFVHFDCDEIDTVTGEPFWPRETWGDTCRRCTCIRAKHDNPETTS